VFKVIFNGELRILFRHKFLKNFQITQLHIMLQLTKPTFQSFLHPFNLITADVREISQGRLLTAFRNYGAWLCQAEQTVQVLKIPMH
jgi:hypothetical protein